MRFFLGNVNRELTQPVSRRFETSSLFTLIALGSTSKDMSIFKKCPICGREAVLKDTERVEDHILRIFECRNGHEFKVKEDEEVLEQLPEWARTLQEELEESGLNSKNKV